MRFIRLLFVLTLAVILLAIALANRGAVTLKAFPASLDQYFGGSWQITLPLFLVIFVAIVFGIIVGFIWEWLREAHIRSEAARRTAEVARLEREVGALRDQHKAPRDEVLAILDNPRPVASGTTLPAPR
ncbi:lipopolysaccharide assembly LapA domain-containing protein [Paracoccus sp. S1E-3]|uniref:LapA family protein n=1 Tax=Paracoccus sp. S1E-3 TaxID=2756130 RepID=UPI0015EE437A|nr:LapA family protein [Paracoccus sp. S1E-3]MBA4491844.1 LapA family protein [Paracoccus sp. S1E-3]